MTRVHSCYCPVCACCLHMQSVCVFLAFNRSVESVRDDPAIEFHFIEVDLMLNGFFLFQNSVNLTSMAISNASRPGIQV